MPSQPQDVLPGLVVGIGASAGGLAAFKTFLANTPADTGMAFILLQQHCRWLARA
jgi:chemotaxis response regulator CheB